MERYKYDAYGRQGILAANGVVSYTPSDYGQFVGFTGRYGDWETGLMFFRARYYDSVIGRFIGRDPYGYVNGKSLYNAYFCPNQCDPSGSQAVVVYTDGTKVTVLNAEQLITVLQSADPRSIATISFYGHGNDDTQTFNPGVPAGGTGAVYYLESIDKVLIRVPNPNGNDVEMDFVDLVKNKLANSARIELLGCLTEPLAKKLSQKLYDRNRTDPSAFGWGQWFANLSPTVSGSAAVNFYIPVTDTYGFYLFGNSHVYFNGGLEP